MAEETAELRDGADVALIGIRRVNMTSIDFVGMNASLKAGHAAHRAC
jgi:hypothetical protein